MTKQGRPLKHDWKSEIPFIKKMIEEGRGIPWFAKHYGIANSSTHAALKRLNLQTIHQQKYKEKQ